MADSFDLVIIDGPPILVGGDCWILSQHADRTIMIVKWGSTSPTMIEAALKQLTSSHYDQRCDPKGAPVIVLNMVERSTNKKIDNAYLYHCPRRGAA